MQKVMDEYAGGISSDYAYSAPKLDIAAQHIEDLQVMAESLKADSLRRLQSIFEVIDRLVVCRVLIRHLAARQETRWRCYQENTGFPQRDDQNWMKYVNSVYKNGNVQIVFRELVGRDTEYEHTD